MRPTVGGIRAFAYPAGNLSGTVRSIVWWGLHICARSANMRTQPGPTDRKVKLMHLSPLINRQWICRACVWVLILTAPAGTGLAADAQTPQEIIESTVTAVTGRLDGRTTYYDEHRGELYTLIDELLLPHFDTRYSGYLVLGKHWKTASKEQRDRFIDVFYRFLLQSYANGILEFQQNSIRVLPSEDEDDGEKRRVVQTEMRLDDGSVVPINYSMRNSKAGWRVYDVRIEGVSYVHNYRNQFSAEIAALGVDALIERLNNEAIAATTE